MKERKEKTKAETLAQRKKRVLACQGEVLNAVGPILAKYGCRLGTVQEFIDGKPGPVKVIVVSLE